MITYYTADANGVFQEEIQIDPYAAMPKGSLTAPPETGENKVAQLQDGQWVILDEYPENLEPEPPKITEITQRQCRLQLLSMGLLDSIDGYIDSLPPEQAAAARIEWEYADIIKRDNPLVLALIQALDLTEEQADEWFNQAGQIA